MNETGNAASGTGGILEQLRSYLPSFSPAERKVADVVLLDPIAVLNDSVTQLALKAEVSPATVIRMCNAIGLRGFQDLKTQITIHHIPSAAPGEIPGENPIQEVLQESAKALIDAAAVINVEAVEVVAAHLAGARRIHVVAVGTSSMLARDFTYRLSMLGMHSTFIGDVHAQHVWAKMLGPEDVLFAISHTGSTFETISAVRSAREAGARITALTSFTSSPLTELCDSYVIAGSAETKIRVEATSSRLVHMAVLDAIHVLLRKQVPGAEKGLKDTAEVIAEHRY
ncbi:MurR/RpiR family transcriptional regulator [Corynebacterium sp. A21]|uniref:MurR/RpiR family transcriptional regulator n=1 Tax=Corynebacterium sp. A21 TaxID=3457318 RepID=UPI003FD013C3